MELILIITVFALALFCAKTSVELYNDDKPLHYFFTGFYTLFFIIMGIVLLVKYILK